MQYYQFSTGSFSDPKMYTCSWYDLKILDHTFIAYIYHKFVKFNDYGPTVNEKY